MLRNRSHLSPVRRARARDPFACANLGGESVHQAIDNVQTSISFSAKIAQSIQSFERCLMTADTVEIHPEELPIHETPVVARRVGTACGVTLEIRRTDDGVALVALPTVEGISVICEKYGGRSRASRSLLGKRCSAFSAKPHRC